jgi:hypothetical protein
MLWIYYRLAKFIVVYIVYLWSYLFKQAWNYRIENNIQVYFLDRFKASWIGTHLIRNIRLWKDVNWNIDND